MCECVYIRTYVPTRIHTYIPLTHTHVYVDITCVSFLAFIFLLGYFLPHQPAFLHKKPQLCSHPSPLWTLISGSWDPGDKCGIYIPLNDKQSSCPVRSSFSIKCIDLSSIHGQIWGKKKITCLASMASQTNAGDKGTDSQITPESIWVAFSISFPLLTGWLAPAFLFVHVCVVSLGLVSMRPG